MKTRSPASISQVCSSMTAVSLGGIWRLCHMSELGKLGVVGVACDAGHLAVEWGVVEVFIVLGVPRRLVRHRELEKERRISMTCLDFVGLIV